MTSSPGEGAEGSAHARAVPRDERLGEDDVTVRVVHLSVDAAAQTLLNRLKHTESRSLGVQCFQILMHYRCETRDQEATF